MFGAKPILQSGARVSVGPEEDLERFPVDERVEPVQVVVGLHASPTVSS
jgi:hypothetical protein